MIPLTGNTRFVDIVKPFKGVLLDALGVFWMSNSAGPIVGTKEAMQQMVVSGKIVGILSNSTQPSSKELEKFQAHGICKNVHFHFLLTSGDIARQIFSNTTLPFPTPNKKVWLFGKPHPQYPHQATLLAESGFTEAARVEEADFIYCTIPHIDGRDQHNKEVFREDVKALIPYKLPIVCANPDRCAFEGMPPQLVVRQGSIAELFEEEGGKVVYIGKPSKIAYEASMKQFELYNIACAKDILMVGDTPETDMRGARSFGMASALIMQTGIMAERMRRNIHAVQSIPQEDRPDFYIQTIASED